ncbi:MAG: hypothetical protein HYY40_01200 [Bacteroidetes bacterium]|nr:hypothetical protein [Bacteroidota bacterium]
MKIKLPFFRIIGIAFNVLGLSNISHAGCCSGGPPANDNFSGAITLTVGAGAVAGNTCGATIEASENLDCNNGAGQSVWYKFTATGTTSYVIVDYTGGACYGGSAVWAVSSLPTGSCPHALSCQYDWYGPDLTKYQLSTVVGTTYYIQVIFWPGGGCGSGWCFNVNVQNSNPGGTITNPGPGLGQNVGTCSSPIAGCYLQQYAPSVATVTSSCPSYAVTLGVNMVWTSCYDFTTNNSEGSVDIQNIVQSNCGPGNVIWANWTLYSATGCNQISCGDLNNVTVGGLTCNTTYVICFTFEVPNCTHTIEYPYLAWSSPAPPACVPPSVTVTITPTNLLCNGVCTGSATANPSGGTLPYNYNWSNGMTTATINNLCAGSYTITVTDNLGVMGTATVNITQPTPLSASSINTNLNCFNVCIGSINLTASGGISPYTYDWGDIAGTNNVEDRNSLCANTYNVTVTDANGCTTPYSVNITQPSDLSLSRIVTNETCDGACNGSIDLTVSGGTGLYTYSWSGGQVTQDISGLCDATYTVTVTDANGCTKTINGTVSQGTVVTSTFTYNGNQCLSGNSFNFTNTGTSGGGVTYSWIFPSGTPATSNVNNPSGVTWSSAGTYAITHTVTNLGCPSTTIINITVFSQPSLSTIVTNLNCFSVCTGAINLTVAGGTAPFNYDWADVAGASNSEDRNSLCAGSYTITVTDANGCTAATTVAVTQPAAPLSATTTQTDVACNGGSTGQATVNPVDGTPGYTYLWNDPAPAQSTQTVTGLTAGTWTVTVTDNKGCTITQSVTITQPALPISISTSQTDVACNGGNTGQATANPSGGTAGYNYVWNDPAPAQSTQTVTGLTAGTWTVTVTDSKGCTAAQSVVITQPALPLTISITKTDVACNGGNTGQATANPAGGTAGYNYVWNDPAPAQSTQTVTGLTAGTWTVTVTDSKGCTATQSVNITQPAGPLNLTMSGTNISCNGLCNGTATATVGGGSIPYTYSWNDPGFQTTSAATGLCAGTFSVTVTDNKGCTITGSRNLTQPAAIVLSTGSVNATCGGSDGQASVSVTSGGTPSFSFLWNDPAPAQTTAAATGLSAGNYGVTITDANSCTATANVTVNDNGSPTATISSSTNVSCNGGNNGSTAVTAGGGTPGYTYNWSTGGTTSSVAGLIAGNYTVTVSDAAGCNATANVTITQPAVLNASVTSATNVSCSGGNNGTATVSVSGGTISYTYNWSAGGQTTSIATGLNANTFTVTVTDSKGCSATASATITQPGPLSTANAVTDNNCNGGNTGSITTTPAGGTAPFGYTWTGGQTNATATGLIAGTYTVTVTDSKGCTATASSTVTQPSGLSNRYSRGGNFTLSV